MMNNLRNEFPILKREINDKKLIYFDNAASTQKPQKVIDAMSQFMQTSYSNIHRAMHSLANESTECYERSREVIAKFLGCKNKNQIIITSGGTDGFNLLASSISNDILQKDDEIILSISEHHANIVPWQIHSKKIGFKIIWTQPDENGLITVETIQKVTTNKTKLISIAHISNVIGCINPIKEICAFAKQNNIISIIDGCQAATHLKINVDDIDCDFYVITGHKLYGPTGIGAVFGNADLLDQLSPFKGGGEMIEKVTKNGSSFAQSPAKFEAGTPPIIESLGLSSALEWMMDNNFQDYLQTKFDITKYIHEYLCTVDGIEFISNHNSDSLLLSYAIKGIHVHDMATFLDTHAIAVRAGHHCAQPLSDHYNIDGTIRLSFAIYNNIDEADKFIEAHQKILKLLKS